MNQLKPYFVTLYTVVAFTILAVATLQLLAGGWNSIWLGAWLAAAPYVGLFLWARYFKRTPRTSRHLPIPTLVTLAGGGLAVFGYFAGTSPNPLFGLLAAFVAAFGFLLYANWYSIFNRRLSDTLATGKPLPAFDVHDAEGNAVSSNTLLGKPALLLFYRGSWCPICMAHVDEVASKYKNLIERGVQIALVSPQPPELTKRVAEYYDVAFNFWVDVDNRAARALGIVDESGVPVGFRGQYGTATVLPTVIIIDPSGEIIFTDQTDNYRVRPNPEAFIEALSVHGY